ncbi:hypothetical protein AWB79_02623 [Caballeronia hypogeia]|jgi:hypothetical protein|uniref:Uncharacterized protein n=1 Tax=Caballeronia hypogeia TaxID=1777140 RepID=A0A158ANC7_9BURK|nr:hypothetical protein AWB79_02623 [Caballeronia hypogeia]
MEFVVLLAIFLTSSTYLWKASVPATPPAAAASGQPVAGVYATGSATGTEKTGP